MDPGSAERTYHNEYLIDRGATWEMVEARLAEEVRFCSVHFFFFLPLLLIVLEHQPRRHMGNGGGRLAEEVPRCPPGRFYPLSCAFVLPQAQSHAMM